MKSINLINNIQDIKWVSKGKGYLIKMFTRTGIRLFFLQLQIFTIGIGKKIDENECIGIASDRTDDHYFPVPNYNALVAITNTVISDVCIAGWYRSHLDRVPTGYQCKTCA